MSVRAVRSAMPPAVAARVRRLRAARLGGPDERGVVSLVVVVVAMALLLSVGLAYDGGEVLAARVAARDQAAEASRAGAQAMVAGARLGPADVDPAIGAAAAEAFLAQSGAQGSVAISGTQVSVTVHATRALAVLGLAGLGPVAVVASASADATAGVGGAGQ